MNYTKEPWVAEQWDLVKWSIFAGKSTMELAMVFNPDTKDANFNQTVGEANAKLIAAAPSLYEALKAAWNEDIDTSLAVHQQIAEALAKAEGK